MQTTDLHERTKRMERAVLAPMVEMGRGFWLFVIVCLAVMAVAFTAWLWQLRNGLKVTGLNNHVPWGFYITNFVFWIGVSHAGTFISAVLRLADVGWRTPVVRMAEFMTIGALFMGAIMPLADLGRPERILNVIQYGSLTSPILWDLVSITSYLVGSCIYLYLPLVPDIATARDQIGHRVGRFRRWFLRTAALGWQGSPQQWARLTRGIRIMCVLIIGVMVSVHTVVSWIFGMTLRPGWHSTIFGPYFVVGAIFSGLAAVLTGMAVFRRIYRLEKYITADHFRWLANILLAAGLFYFYFTFSEYVTIAYKQEPHERNLLNILWLGPYASLFWFYAFGGHLLPMLVMSLPWTRNIPCLTVASVFINIGMWVKRYVITVPSLAAPQLLPVWGAYSPTWVEMSIVAGSFAGFMLIVAGLARVFPLIPMWEMAEEMEKEPLRRDMINMGPGREVAADD